MDKLKKIISTCNCRKLDMNSLFLLLECTKQTFHREKMILRTQYANQFNSIQAFGDNPEIGCCLPERKICFISTKINKSICPNEIDCF